MQANYKRRNYFINKEVQIRFAALLVMISLITSAQLLAYILFIDTNITEQAAKFGLAENQMMVSFITVKQKQWLLTLIGYLVGNMLLVGLFGLFFSHRISGPVYHMERFLKRVAEGDLSGTLRIRKSDQFQSVAATINLMMECLRQKRRDELETMRTLQKQLSSGKVSNDTLSMLDTLCRQCEADLFSNAAAAGAATASPNNSEAKKAAAA
jgi:nitrogen fixation/metabolism regulation signal transduction histidine kinase